MQVKSKDSRLESDRNSNNNFRKIFWVISAIPLLLITLILWGLIEPYILDEEEEEAVIPNLPSAWSGKKVAQLSDFQVGMWWDNVDTVKDSVEKIIESQPAAVFITGDFIYHANPDPQPEIDEVVSLLRPLQNANIPTYAVLGNHDYGIKNKGVEPDLQLAAQLEQGLENIGIEVLNNQAVQIPLQNQVSDLYVVGIDSHWANDDQVELALSQIPDNSPRIVMMHNPDSFIEFPANTAPFAIAGHTHGGQIRLPYMPQWSWLSFAKEDKVLADEWVEEDYGKAGNRMYINRGIGFSDAPIRINCAPEITFFTLRSQATIDN
ncbi:MAG: metallophosphoesterase [Cyanobacteria bacterium P01_A01_bin.40]